MALADELFPAREEPVNNHAVKAENYMNRLWAYGCQRIDSDREREILLAEMEDIGTRLDAVNNLANKGLHDSITKPAADRLVIRTYLALADLLGVD